jgi:ABC-type glycerol-3-phosphate transport system substrate-binding protein
MRQTRPSSAALTRRQLLKFGGIGGASIALAACSSGEPTPPPERVEAPRPKQDAGDPFAAPGTPSTTAEAAPTRIAEKGNANVWMAFALPDLCTAMNAMGDAHVQAGGAPINPVDCNWGGDNFAPVLKSRMGSSNPPDAIIVSVDSLSDMITQGLLDPLDELLSQSQYSGVENWPAGLMRGATRDGKVHGLPLVTAPFALYYNTALFEKKGVPAKREDFPKTLDELRRLSKTFTEWRGDALVSAGFLPKVSGADLPQWFAVNGGGMYDADAGKFVINQDRNVQITEFLLDWHREEYRGVASRARSTVGFSSQSPYFELPPAFSSSALAMEISSVTVTETLARRATGDIAKAWNVAPFPAGPGADKPASFGFTLWGMIPKGARVRDDAFKYLDFVGGRGLAELPVTELGTLIAANKTVEQTVISPALEKARDTAFATDLLAFFRQQAQAMTTLDDSPITNFASGVLTLNFDDVLTGKARAREALDATQKMCQDRLDQLKK